MTPDRAPAEDAPDVYASTDVETDGPIPGRFSMLSLASVAFDASGEVVGRFTVNLLPLEDAVSDPSTMRWWERHPEAWADLLVDRRPADVAMPAYAEWLDGLPGVPRFVAYPVGFDFTFVSWYLHRFAGRNPFQRATIDIRTYAMAMLGVEYGATAKHRLPERWTADDVVHTHKALDDAEEQGRLFMRMLAESRLRNRPEPQ